MTEKNFEQWLFLDAYVYSSVKPGMFLLYNSLTGDVAEFIHPEIIDFGRALTSETNMNVMGLTRDDMDKGVIREFIREVRDKLMGDTLSTRNIKNKPVQMKPLVKVERDVAYLKSHPLRSVGDYMMDYLSEISFYINGDCKQNCPYCDLAYKQTQCCTKNKHGELGLELVKNFLEECGACTILNYNILGGDIFSYSMLGGLISLLNTYKGTKTYYVNYRNLNHARLQLLENGNNVLNVIVNGDIDKKEYVQIFNILSTYIIQFNIEFHIESAAQYALVEKLLEEMPGAGYRIVPVFNGSNQPFFEDNIYMTKDDVLDSKPGLHEIYARQKLNTNYFGRLTVLNNGWVYGNINQESLGFLQQNPLSDILLQEMDKGLSWRKLRSGVAPCNECAYEHLCPSLSNYEQVLGRNNLCHIFQGTAL